jgi:hypothetical protein
MSFLFLYGGALSAMTHGATPGLIVVWDEWIKAERLNNGRFRRPRLCGSLMTRGALVGLVELWNPQLVGALLLVSCIGRFLLPETCRRYKQYRTT